MKILKVLFIGLLLLSPFFGYSQYCNTATSNVSITPTTTSQLTTSYSSGRRAFNFVATAGCVYEFSTCGQSTNDTYLRLYSTGTGGTLLAQNDNFCGTQSTLTWTATVNGTVSVLLTRASCNALSIATKMSYRRISCDPPPCATLISPTNNSTGININQTISWNSVSTATSYDVYFGTNSSPPLVTNQTTTTYNPGTLNYSTTYYWRVIAKNSNGSAVSCSTWSFMTKPVGCLTATYGQFPTSTYNPGCSGTTENITTVGYASEYSLVSLISNVTYTLSSSVSTDFITISDETGTTLFAYGTGSVVYNCITDGNYRFYTHTNEFCGSSTTSRARRIQCSTPPPPSNDLVGNAIDLGICGGTVNGNTKFATNVGDGPSCYTASGETWTAPGVWYKVKGNGKNVNVSLCGSSFDTKLFVYTGTPSNLTCLNFNDDFCSLQSELNFTSTNDTIYHILVTGYGSSKGAFNLSVTLGASAPIITSQPQGDTICLGQSHTFSVTSTGVQSPLTYQWYLNNNAISGATSPTYSTNVAGNYYVIVSNSCSKTAQSNLVTLTTLSPPNLTTSVSDISCSGGGNGSIDLIVSGLGSPFSFNWVGPNGFTSTSEDITNLSTGIYTVTVTNYIGCQSTKTVTVSEPSSLVLTLVGSNVPCYGQSSGNIDLIVSGGTPPYSYLWSNGSTSQDLTNLSSGTYTINVTDNSNCVATSSITISQPSTPISLSTQIQNVSCYNGSDGGIDLTVTGGTPPFTYSWSNSSTSEDLSGITIGTYSVVVKDNNGCQETTTVNITQPTDINISMNVQNVNCYGQSTGMIYTNVSGGSPTYTYSWSNGSNSQNLNYIIAGSYTVTVTDSKGCIKTKDTTITQNPQIVVSITKTNVTCNGYNDGSISASVLGGVPPYTYTWAHGPTTSSISNLNSGNYTLYVTDSKGCTKSTMIYISQPQPLVVSVNSPTISACQLTQPVLLTSSVNGGVPNYNYSWSNGVTTNTISVSPTTTTIYTIQVTDINGCMGVAQSTVTVSQNVVTSPVGSVVGPTQVYPYMISGNVATYSVSPVVGATNYQWYIPNHGVFFVTNSDSNVINVQINQNFSVNSNGGEFFVKVTDGCGVQYSDTLKVVILEDPIIVGSNCGIPSGVINTYHVSNSLPGLTYNWIRPYGTNMFSGQGNDTCKIKFSQYMQSPSTLSVSVSTIYGTVYGSLEILKNSTTPTNINGETSVCANGSTIYEYYVDSVPTATGYIWNVPSGAIILDGQGNDTIHVKYNTTFVSGSMNVQSYNQCGSSPMRYLNVSNNNLSFPIGSISGPGDLCPYLGSTTTYSVQFYQGYTYTWVVPQGFTIVSGQGTNVITVSISPNFTSGSISVQMNEGCGVGLPTTLNLSTTQTTINTSNILGPTTVCTIVGTTQTATYSITPVSGVNYSWSVPTNATIVSGQNSNIINVSFQVGFNGGNISVLVSGGCAQPITKTITLVTNPPNVMSITGTRCIENNTTYYYSVSSVSGALSYNWTAPGNAIVTGGQGTNQISVFYPSNFETNCLNNLCDSLRLTVQFSCGFRKKAVQIGMTTYPVTTIYGPSTTCPPDTIQLSASTSLRATNYFWGSPNGTQFVNLTGLQQANLGQIVNSKINTTFLGGSYNVQTINQCGSSPMRYFYVSKSCAAKMMGDTTTNEQIFNDEWQKSLSDPIDFVIFPNPTKGLLQLRIFRGSDEYYLVTIYDKLGVMVYQGLKEKEDSLNISELGSGIYTIRVTDKNLNTISKQVIVL